MIIVNMNRILLIEDDGFMTKVLKDALIRQKYEVICAYSCASATGLWEKYDGQIDCIILDLNINPDGLDQVNSSKYFPIHGILVLNEICNGKNPDETKKIWNKTVIFSRYTDILREKKSDFGNYNCLEILPKTGISITILIERVKQILQ